MYLFRFDAYGQYQPKRLYFDPEFDKYRSADDGFSLLDMPLLVRSFGLRRRDDVEAFRLPSDRLRLYLYCPMGEEFFAQVGGLVRQNGYVLYIVELPVPES